MGIPKCSECEYCANMGSGKHATRNSFYCDHPDEEHIRRYFIKNRIFRAYGFIAFGEPFKQVPAIKTSPKWCPKRAK